MCIYKYSTCIFFFSYIAFLPIGAAGVKICGQCVAVVGVGRQFRGCVSVTCTDSAKWLTVDDDQFWALTTKISNAAVVSKKGEFTLLLAPASSVFFIYLCDIFAARVHACTQDAKITWLHL